MFGYHCKIKQPTTAVELTILATIIKFRPKSSLSCAFSEIKFRLFLLSFLCIISSIKLMSFRAINTVDMPRVFLNAYKNVYKIIVHTYVENKYLKRNHENQHFQLHTFEKVNITAATELVRQYQSELILLHTE